MPETYIPADLDPTYVEPAPIEAVYVGTEVDEPAAAAGPLGGELLETPELPADVVYAEVDDTVPTEPIAGDQGPTAEAEIPVQEPEATQEASGTIISTDPAPEETSTDA